MMVIERLGPMARDPRREVLARARELNGIAEARYVRPGPGAPHQLRVSFWAATGVAELVKNLQAAIAADATPLPITIEGGDRIRGLKVLAVGPGASADTIRVDLSGAGDGSPYWLCIGWLGEVRDPAFAGFDPAFSVARIDFRIDCPTDADCATPITCEPEAVESPRIDYQARDFASFRRMLLDVAAQRNLDWEEEHPAELGATLVELLAYEGDHLAYLQDAVAAEGYLETARSRISLKRHARLIDYRVDDGRSAWAMVHCRVAEVVEAPATLHLLTRLNPAATEQIGPVVTILAHEDLRRLQQTPGAMTGVQPFERALDRPQTLRPACNRLHVHDWGIDEYCLPRATVLFHVYGVADDTAIVAQGGQDLIARGDFLVLEPTDDDGDGVRTASRELRQLVRVAAVRRVEDPLFTSILKDDRPVAATADVPGPPLPLLEVQVSPESALRAELPVNRMHDKQRFWALAARGNLLLVDHGETVREEVTRDAAPEVFRVGELTLSHGPVSQRAPLDPLRGLPSLEPRSVRADVEVSYGQGATGKFTVVHDLLASGPDDAVVVVDVERDGLATLRFGDDRHGRAIDQEPKLEVRYRVGNGRAGNVAAEAIHHVVRPADAAASGFYSPLVLLAVRNPLPAQGGADPEDLESIRVRAPASFRLPRKHAVTEQDWIEAALGVAGVAGAVAALRWTGAWFTVVVAVDPDDPLDVEVTDHGAPRLTGAFEARVWDALDALRIAGYELDVRAAEYVPLELDIELCVDLHHPRGDVIRAVHGRLGGRRRGDAAGLFHGSRLSFGQPVALSAVLAAIADVPGLCSSRVTRLRALRSPGRDATESGLFTVDPWEIARLDDDPQRPEHGVLRVTAKGGR